MYSSEWDEPEEVVFGMNALNRAEERFEHCVTVLGLNDESDAYWVARDGQPEDDTLWQEIAEGLRKQGLPKQELERLRELGFALAEAQKVVEKSIHGSLDGYHIG